MMGIFKEVYNGMATSSNGENVYVNAHISYKGRSVIVDYEHCLHAYSLPWFEQPQSEMFVPIEMYPYNGNDIYTNYIPLDEKFHKVDLVKLIEVLDIALENESDEEEENNI